MHDPWWTKSKADVHTELFRTFKLLDENQQGRHELNLHNMRMYSNNYVSGLNGIDYALMYDGNKLRLNVIRSVIDTAAAHLATNRPRPRFLTIDGNFGMQRKARGLNDFVSGQFYALKQYEVGMKTFFDGAIFGTGLEKVYVDKQRNQVAAERVFTDEIVIDDREARYGKPRTMYQHTEADKWKLSKQYPKLASAIYTSAMVREGMMDSGQESSSDPVSLVEGWHLPDIVGGKGRHTMAVTNAPILDEPWDAERFPFSIFRWADSPLGFWGNGLSELLTEIQVEINYLLQKIQHLMTLATSQVWVRKGSKINISSMNNDDFAIRTFEGQQPLFMAVQSVSPEYFSHVDRLFNRSFEVAGISQLQATSKKPQGLDSGVALREYNDISSQRFLHVQQRWENFHLDAAKLQIGAAKKIAEDTGSYKVLAKGKNSLREVDFAKLQLDDDKHVMQCFPTNFLPETPAGKLQTIKEFAEISPEMQQYLIAELDFPDLEAATSLITSPIEMCDMLLEEMLEHGNYRPPTPFMLPYAELFISRMSLALLRADINGAPEDNLDQLRTFLSEFAELQNPTPPTVMAEQAAAPQLQAGPVDPAAGPPMPAIQPPGAGPMAMAPTQSKLVAA